MLDFILGDNMPEKTEVCINEEINPQEFHISPEYAREVLNIDEDNTELWAGVWQALCE